MSQQQTEPVIDVCYGDICGPPAPGSSDSHVFPSAPAAPAPAPTRTLKVEIISDNICPFCYIGYKRLLSALSMIDRSQVSVELEFRAFLLDPTLPSPGIEKSIRYKQKFGSDAEKILNSMVARGKADGINFSFKGKVGSTMDSHRLLQLAKERGRQLPLIEELFKGYFEQEMDISSIPVLLELAGRAGLDQEDCRRFLENPSAGLSAVQAELQRARSLKISGVPHFLFNGGGVEIGGAQSVEVFQNALKTLGF